MQPAGEKTVCLRFVLNRVTWIAIVFIFAGIPLLVNPTAFDYWYKPKIDSLYALIVIIFASGWLQRIFFRHKVELKKTCLFIPLCLYSFSVVVSTVRSIDYHLSLTGDLLRYESIFTLLAYVVLVFLFSSLVQREAEVHTLMRLLLLSTALISLYAAFQYAGYSFTEHFIVSFRQTEHRVGSTIGNPNFLAKFLVLVLPLYLAYLINSPSPGAKIVFAAGFVLSFCALIFTFTRSSWIGFGVSMAFFFLICPGKQPVSRRMKKIVLSAGLVLLIFFSVGVYFAEETPENRETFWGTMKYKLHSAFDLEQGMGTATRLFVWKKTAGIIAERPLFGHGPDTHVRVMRRFNLEYCRKFNNYVVIDRSHNNYLDIAVAQGLFGLGAYLSVVVTFITWLWRTFQQERHSDRKRVYACILASFCGYLVNDLFIFSVVSVSPTFWALMGLTVALKAVSDSGNCTANGPTT